MEYIISAEAVAIAIKEGWDADSFRHLQGQTLDIDISKEYVFDLDGIGCILLDTAKIEGMENIGELYMPVDALEEPKSNEYEMTFLEKIEEDKKNRDFKKMVESKIKKDGKDEI